MPGALLLTGSPSVRCEDLRLGEVGARRPWREAIAERVIGDDKLGSADRRRGRFVIEDDTFKMFGRPLRGQGVEAGRMSEAKSGLRNGRR